METWAIIKDYPRYSVSNLGRIMNNATRKILKGHVCGKGYKIGKGYLTVVLRNPQGEKPFMIHRLVATYFVPNLLDKPMVNHKDGNTCNNCAANLEWVTNQENIRHSFDVLNRRRFFGPENHRSRKVVRLEDGKIYECMKYAAEDNHLSRGNLTSACKGILKTSGGYHWAYLEENKHESC